MRDNRPSAHLLAFVPAIERGDLATADEYYLSTGAWLPAVMDLHRAILASELFLTPNEFAWAAWRGEARRLVKDLVAIREVDLATIRKLLAAIWHQQRTVGGMFPAVCSDGVMLAILQRLKEIEIGVPSDADA